MFNKICFIWRITSLGGVFIKKKVADFSEVSTLYTFLFLFQCILNKLFFLPVYFSGFGLYILQLVGDFDVIVNCSGLGARTLANDDSVFPINGHIFRVRLNVKIGLC